MTNPPTRLIIIRHAQPQTAAGRCYGSLDLPLSPTGHQQATTLATNLATHAQITALYTSPRQRATATAAPIAARCHLPLTTHHALQELDFGELEGRTYNQIRQTMPQLYQQWMHNPTNIRFPGGESFADLYQRATTTANEIRQTHPGQTTALITHAGVCRALIAHALHLPHQHIFRLEISHTRLTIIDWHHHTPIIRLLNGPSTNLPQKGRSS